MNLKFSLVIGFCFLFFATSCSNKGNIENIADKQTYISQIEKLSDNDRKQQLERDANLLEQTLDSISDLTMFFSFSLSMRGDSSSDVDTAQVFTINSQEEYLKDFLLINNDGISADQKFTEGKANFNFYAFNANFAIIDQSDLKYDINDIYKNGKPLENNQNFLTVVDSLDVKVSYSYPLAFDTITIEAGTDSVLYNGQTIDIEVSEGNTIELKYPSNLNILGYKAVNADGVLMDKSSNSSFPIFGFSPIIIDEIKKTINLLRQAAQTNDKTQSLAYLKELPENIFSKISLMIALEKEYRESKKKKNDDTDFLIDQIKEMMEKYAPLFAITKQTLDLTFPMSYQQVYLYVATKMDTVSSKVKVIPYSHNVFRYNVFTDSTETKYGVVDNSGKIIIPATYSAMQQYDSLYFHIKENDKEKNVFLNTQTQEFEVLSSETQFESQLTADLAVFSNKDSYYGILKNNKTEIIPFKYDGISKIGKTVVAQASKRGRPFYLFYTLDGKQMDIAPMKEINADEEKGDIIIVSADHKYGYINNQGTLVIAPKYKYLAKIGDDLLGFIIDKEILAGVIDNKGNVIVKPTFNYIGSFHNDRAIVKIKIDTNDYYDNSRYGYINKKGEIVIQPKYSNADDFYKGYALVVDNDIYYLIDIDGNIIKKFDADYVNFYQDDDSDKTNPTYFYQTSDEKKYNYKGELLK